MNRDRRLANGLLLIYGAISVLALTRPLSAPVMAVRTCVSYLFNPIPYFGTHAIDRLAAVPSGFAHLISADIENHRLREGLKQLPLMEAEMKSLKLENERLRATLGFSPLPEKNLRWARVIEREPVYWHRTLLVDSGREQGIKINAPVLGISRGRLGLVGRVTELGPRWAKVLLMTDDLSSVAAYLPGQGWEGLVEGRGGPYLRMNYLPIDAKLETGQAVFTSVTSASFPQDIPVGRVTRLFQQDPFLTFQSVQVAPEIEASSLKEVLILEPKRRADENIRPSEPPS
ncbi:MAG: rod shape-determining protein MreC [Elusimicrobia bacterium]|nr:rod shape-determining protein MreC [Elusimicrobiota bacterium]